MARCPRRVDGGRRRIPPPFGHLEPISVSERLWRILGSVDLRLAPRGAQRRSGRTRARRSTNRHAPLVGRRCTYPPGNQGPAARHTCRDRGSRAGDNRGAVLPRSRTRGDRMRRRVSPRGAVTQFTRPHVQDGRASPTVAIMQPYFVPYAGYFRLLAAADLFVLYDCVQFPRRGWVHRNRLPDATGRLQWLTLPLAKAPRQVSIRDLRFRPDAAAALTSQSSRFPLLARRRSDPHGLLEALTDVSGTPLDYVERLLARCAAGL